MCRELCPNKNIATLPLGLSDTGHNLQIPVESCRNGSRIKVIT